ncbi:MAG: PspC domain-containing protein, partial [Solirubrobacteraceae bacterium]
MTAFEERPGPAVTGPARGREGGWLGGVCVGLQPLARVSVGWIRLAFAVSALVGGVGIALYLACWLIVPLEGERETGGRTHEAVAVARACAVGAGLAALAALGALAAVFGYGWIVVGLGAAVLIGVLAGWRRLGPAWALLPVAALTLPAIAVAASGLRLAPQV